MTKKVVSNRAAKAAKAEYDRERFAKMDPEKKDQ